VELDAWQVGLVVTVRFRTSNCHVSPPQSFGTPPVF
jgi:hypothetical protein